LEADAQRAAVWGRRTERRPEASVYNKLTDLEWRLSWPYGETALFGGDVLLRTRALEEAGGYDETLIAGEEPELALRLNRAGWTIYRLDREMTRHDAAMTRFSQWWKRCVRAGHAAAEGAWRYGRGPERYGVKPSLSAWVWGAGLPAAAVLTAFLFHPAFLALFLLYPLSAYKIYRYYRRTTGASPGDCALYAAACVAAKPPQWLGQCVFLRNLVSGRRRKLIEYK
jgi:GT2 family glycosyltransferase